MSSLPADIERVTTHIAGMNRKNVEQELLQFKGHIKLDFSPEYLGSLPLDRLRHILLAAHLQRPLH